MKYNTSMGGGGQRKSKLNFQNPQFKEKLFTIFFIAFLCIYLLNIAIFPNFGVIDDHIVISTLAKGEFIPLFILPSIGRFYPLDAMDLNIIYAIFGLNINAIYIFTAIFALITALCLFFGLKIILDSVLDSTNLTHSNSNPNLTHQNLTQNAQDSTFQNSTLLAMIAITLFMLTPAFATAFLRLFVPEKLESVFFAIFIFTFIKFSFKNSNFYFLIALISGSLALYFKEVAFIMLGSFAFFHLIFSAINDKMPLFKPTKPKILDLALILSCVVWVVLYFIFVILEKTNSGRYGDTPYSALLVFAKSAINYALSEPFLFIGIFVLALFRIFCVSVKKERINPFLDSCILASALHSLAYLALNIYSFHYPLPAYIFALFPLAYYFRKYWGNLAIKGVFGLCVVIFILNSLPAFIYQFNHYKAVPNNYQATLSFLDSYIKENPHTNIYLDGVNRASSGEVYHSFIKNLEFKGLKDFDFYSDLGIDNEILGKENPNSPYAVFKSNEKVPKKPGDLVVITPYMTFNIDENYIKNHNYELLFESKWGLNIPLLGIKSALKSMVSQSNPSLVLSQNIYALPIHFSVYRVKGER